MTKEKKPIPKFSNQARKNIYGTWPFEKEYNALLDTQAPKEDFMRIIGAGTIEMFYYFQMRTPTQSGSFHIANPLGCIDELWAFLEDLCLGKEFVSFLTQYEDEGSNALLCAKAVDKENVRVSLIGDAWLELDDDGRGFTRNYWPDFKPRALIDAVVNKRHFIYTLYLALADVFVDDNLDYSIRPLSAQSTENAQVDSTIVKEYLGYILPTDKDEVLRKALFEGVASDVEKALLAGGNPNAILVDECVFGETIMEDFWHMAYEDPKKIDADDYFKKNELLLKYGAMPRTTFFIFYTGADWGEDLRLKIFRLFFEKHCFIRFDFWDFVVFDAHNDGADDWAIYEEIVKKGLWSRPSYYACWQEC